MNDVPPILPGLAGLGGVAALLGLAVKAFLQALKATADVSEEKNHTIARQADEADRLRNRIDLLEQELTTTRAALAAADLKVMAYRQMLRTDPPGTSGT